MAKTPELPPENASRRLALPSETAWFILALAGAGAGGALLVGPVHWGLGAGFLVGAGIALAWGLIRAAHRMAESRSVFEHVARILGSDRASPDAEPGPHHALAMARSAADLIGRLRSEERDLRAMFDAVDSAVVSTDGSGMVRLCNAAAAEFVGRPAPMLIGRRIEEVFTQADLLDLHASAVAGHTHSRHIRFPRPGGMRTFEVFASPLAGGTAGAVVILRDVSELARAAQVRTDFVVNASHELRTPIAALRMAAETLEGGAGEDPAMLKRLLGIISGHVARLEDLTTDLMDLSRLESPEYHVTVEPVPASALAEELGALFAGVCRQRRLNLVFEFEPSLEGLRTDRNLVFQILRNLIDNATKFANEGTPVRVVGKPAGGGGVRFEVIDQGLGIPLNQQDRVFERFYQIDEARTAHAPGIRRGTGLGLAIVKHSARLLGGQVRVQSVWKQGTTMIVELPDGLPAPEGGPTTQWTSR